MNDKINTEELKEFSKAFLMLRNEEEVNRFLKDLLSSTEIQNLSRRFKAAQMLESGYPYTEIERNTGLSSATIAKVSEALKYGYDGFKLALERMKKRK